MEGGNKYSTGVYLKTFNELQLESAAPVTFVKGVGGKSAIIFLYLALVVLYT